MSAGCSEVVDRDEVSSAEPSASMFLDLVDFVSGGSGAVGLVFPSTV